LLEQPEVLPAASRMGDADNCAGGLLHDELRLQGVAFFLARVVAALLF
jgi:hypothetical protein